MIEKSDKKLDIKVIESEILRRNFQNIFCVKRQQPERVAVTCDCVWTHLTLLDEPAGEVLGQQSGKISVGIHECILVCARSSFRAACSISCGTALRYQ